MAAVPAAAGVPALSSAVSVVSDGLALLQGDTYQYFQANFGPQWGVFLDGAPVVTADTVISFAWKKDWSISDFPVERGSFESFDKVEMPFDARVRFASGGSDANRRALLDSIAAIAGDLNLYDVATPEATYINVNVHHYDYQRTSLNGLGVIVVDVWLQEVRVTVSDAGAGVATPSAASPVNGGMAQPQTPSAPVYGAMTGLRAASQAQQLANGERAL